MCVEVQISLYTTYGFYYYNDNDMLVKSRTHLARAIVL